MSMLGAVKAAAGISFTAAGAAAATGPDLAGVALLITAISGLIGTVGALFLATRKKPTDPQDLALLALAERLTREDPDDQA